jgi:hypothetical protein
VVSDPALAPLCDKTIADDAVRKLQLGADFSQRTGRPWFEPGVSILRAVHCDCNLPVPRLLLPRDIVNDEPKSARV